MSFSRSGSTAPAFSFPIGVGTFTDVNASLYRGDGGLTSHRTTVGGGDDTNTF